jgi:hypothetical protein
MDVGSTVLDESTLSQHADALKHIGQALNPGCDLQLYEIPLARQFGMTGQPTAPAGVRAHWPPECLPITMLVERCAAAHAGQR